MDVFKILRRTALALIASVFTLATQAQTYPNKPVIAVVGSPPGQSSDLLMRLLAQRLQPALGQPVITENRPGAGASLGPAYVAKSAPDGYTLLLGTSGPLTIRPNIYTSAPYDPIKSFEPVAAIGSAPLVLAVSATSDIKSIADLVRRALEKPDEITYGSPGVGSINQLTAEMLGMAAKVKFRHVPYKGSPLVFADIIGGHIHFVADPVPGIMSMIKGGKLRAIAVTGASRSPMLPDVPTLDEAGYKGLRSEVWFGVLAPAGTPVAVLDRLEREFTKIKAMPDVQAQLADWGLTPVLDKRAALAEMIRKDTATWKQVITAIGGIKPEE